MPFLISFPIEVRSTGVPCFANAVTTCWVYDRTVAVSWPRSWPAHAAGMSWCCGSAQKSEYMMSR